MCPSKRRVAPTVQQQQYGTRFLWLFRTIDTKFAFFIDFDILFLGKELIPHTWFVIPYSSLFKGVSVMIMYQLEFASSIFRPHNE